MAMRTISPVLIVIALLPVMPDLAWGQSATARTETPAETPNAEMLEFLGSFEDKDAGWVDPFELEEMERDNAPREENSNGK